MGNDDLIAGRTLTNPENLTTEEKSALEAETYLRSFLEQARKVSKVAVKHIGGQPNGAVVHISRPWKRELAVAAINHINSGGNVKAFANVLTDLEFVNDENKGEIMGFWGKRMLPQIFKWSDDEKSIICGKLNEGAILSAASEFICNDLGLSNIEIESGVVDVGRSSAAIPLAPSIVYN